MTTAHQFWNTARQGRFANRTAVIVATTIGVAVGATGLAAAQSGPSPDDGVSPSLIEVPDTTTATAISTVASTVASTVVDDTVATTVAGVVTTQPSTQPTSVTAVTIDVPVPTPETTTEAPPTTITITTVDGSTSSTTPDSTIADPTFPATTITTDDSTSSTTPDTTTGSTVTTVDGSVPTTSTAPSLPAPFTETYNGGGGSITVTWSGTSLTLVAVSPDVGYQADIEDNTWDRIRVDFDNDHDDHRIEVRLNDGAIRVRNG